MPVHRAPELTGCSWVMDQFTRPSVGVGVHYGAVNGYPSDEHRFENDRQIGHASECESGGVSAEGAGTLGALAEPFLKSATFPGLIRQRGRRYIWQSSRESWP